MPNKPPSPVLAALLAIVSPGLGHLYLGLRGWFLGVLLCAGVFLLVGLLAAASLPGPWGLVTSALLALGWLLVWPVHAYRRARTASSSEVSSRTVSWWVLIPVAVLTYTANGVLRPLRPIRTFEVTSSNMEPAILPGDRVVMIPLERDGPAAGDITVYRVWDSAFPATFIGRVVALEGDTIHVQEGIATVNGLREDLDRPNLDRLTRSGSGSLDTPDFGPLVVPEDHVFVMGDRRFGSIDSRFQGPIPLEEVQGRIVRIYFSSNPHRFEPRWERIGAPLQ